ncbi:MAG: hypothetical protein IKC65_06710 [Lentisphaeria bacterium]|nr:hypothetical protein [Lentisphaeria bacterium]
MRKNLFLLLLLFLAGCAGNTMVLNGEKIDILSPEEELELISTARATLAKSKRLTPNEQRIVKAQKPVFKIRYTSSRTGDATCTWKLPGKSVTLLIRGTFFEGSAQWVMKLNNDQPGALYFKAKDPLRVDKR